MVSETLAGTNAGVSEVGLSDTSSSKPNPLNGAIAANPVESLVRDVRASAAAPRQGWWKRRDATAAANGTALVQVGGMPDSVKTTTPDMGGPAQSGTIEIPADASCGEAGSGLHENEDQAIGESAVVAASPALPPNGF